MRRVIAVYYRSNSASSFSVPCPGSSPSGFQPLASSKHHWLCVSYYVRSQHRTESAVSLAPTCNHFTAGFLTHVCKKIKFWLNPNVDSMLYFLTGLLYEWFMQYQQLLKHTQSGSFTLSAYRLMNKRWFFVGILTQGLYVTLNNTVKSRQSSNHPPRTFWYQLSTPTGHWSIWVMKME